MNIVELHEPLKTHWAGKNPFDQAAALDGQVFRAVKNRRTLRFELDGKGYFAKIHTGVGWRRLSKSADAQAADCRARAMNFRRFAAWRR